MAVLQKASLSLPDGLQQDAAPPDVHETVADGFRQGTEPSRRFLVDLNTGLVKEHISEMDRRGMSEISLILPFYHTIFLDTKTDICLFPLIAFIPASLSDGKAEMEQWLDDGKRYIKGYTH